MNCNSNILEELEVRRLELEERTRKAKNMEEEQGSLEDQATRKRAKSL